MLNYILKWSIAQRWIVVIASVIISIWGIFVITQMPLDVIPNFAPPQVQIQTEAPGLAPDEVESLITLPMENSLNGTPGIELIRSSSAVGLSVVTIVFEEGTDIYQARQQVTERLQQVQSNLPEGVETPELTPTTSPIGDILKYALTSETTPMMEVTRLANWQIKNRILGIPGISQVVVFGGEERQYQVLADPARLQQFNLSLAEVTEAAANSNQNASGGFLLTPDSETIVKQQGRVTSIADIENSVIAERNGTPVRLGDVADVKIGAAVKRGDGALGGKPAVVLMIKKQPLGDTVKVTEDVEAAMEEIAATLPKDVKLTRTFRQADFIESSVKNVEEALRDGVIIVSVILILFLMNWRTVIITLSAMPLSLIVGLMLLAFEGDGINTMTLGGLVVAIGSVVDDAIVDMENVYRRLRENQQAGTPVPPLQIVFNGSVEVRVSVLFSTVIIAVVFAPVFALSGVEGRIFTPMAITYLLAIAASTLVAVTLTPALCALLLANSNLPPDETWIARFFERIYRPILGLAIKNPKITLMSAVAALIASIIIVTGLGKVFLPEFQEQSQVVAMSLYPGVSLDTTRRAAVALSEELKDNPDFETIQLRAGRASGDIEVNGVNFAELDIQVKEEATKKLDETLETLRAAFEKIPGVVPSVGGFITHRIDETLSGVRSAIAVKIYGPELEQLRSLGTQIQSVMSGVTGVTDLQLEPQVPIKQLQIEVDREAASRYGLSVGAIGETIETALNGREVSQVLEKQQLFPLVVWLQPEARRDIENIKNLFINTANFGQVPLSQVAKIDYGTGPNTINREDVSRRLIVSANTSGRDLGSVIGDIRDRVQQEVQIPTGYFIEYGGQFEAQERATQSLLVFSAIAFVAIAVMMYFAVKSIPSTIAIMINLPLALVGGVISIALTGGVLSIASLVGFITLFGVAARNGLLLVENYNAKIAAGIPLKKTIVEGSLERLNAILMTALTSALGMAPLAIGSGPGKEMLQPLAVVVLGGLFTSTALTLLVLPALYSQFGRFFIPKKIDTNFSVPEAEKLSI
ncbi:cation efflux system protein (plasmid) [Chondrocystis sp. NIES-4102]|nr:cation efflux system protein [Chondrocystis sp. NIES-4102]